ncbi:MAG: RnfH family protein [Betaproteobacteria bacterium]|nr:RnfH family protein [Betaproteobacteria bacterium]
MKIRVAVVYALPEAQAIVELELRQGATVADALAASRLQDILPGNSFAGLRIGVWGASVLPDTELRDRDRVEIYRGLVADPKQARRKRARQQRVSRMRR